MSFPVFSGDNPQLWKTLCEQYFQMFPVHDSYRVPMAILNFSGPASIWLQSVQKKLIGLDWDSFTSLLCTRFGRDKHQMLIRQFYAIKQTTSIADFIERFESLMNHLISYSEFTHPYFFLTHFVEGLRPDIRAWCSCNAHRTWIRLVRWPYFRRKWPTVNFRSAAPSATAARGTIHARRRLRSSVDLLHQLWSPRIDAAPMPHAPTLRTARSRHSGSFAARRASASSAGNGGARITCAHRPYRCTSSTNSSPCLPKMTSPSSRPLYHQLLKKRTCALSRARQRMVRQTRVFFSYRHGSKGTRSCCLLTQAALHPSSTALWPPSLKE
nr:uncharacterized protein LOC109773719 isoform X1 [Aegilops tauschii subsp. strangulata]XP_040259515.1 uncharacterized protein LOC109773719 isoform X2 [Aegilops tauschii subsp. strangulata]